jgi:hypothetical protein
VNSHDARSDPGAQAEGIPGAGPGAGSSAGRAEAPAGEASAGRGAPEWRQLSFRASGLTIELEIAGTGDDRRLTGQLIPRQPAVVDIRHPGGLITVEADALGRFSAEAVPLGQISLRCRLGPEAGQSDVVTGWISL